MNIKKIIAYIIRKLLVVLTLCIRDCIPKKKNLIIMQSNSLYRYCENTRYLYEYLQDKEEFDVYWDTANHKIYDYLSSKGYKVLWHHSFKSYLTYLRAKIVVGTGSSHPDFLRAVGRKTIKYCLFHGSGPKAITTVWETLNKTLKEIYNHHRYDFFNTTSVFDCVVKGRITYKLPHSKLVINGYPRCDHLFDKEKVKSMYKNKTISKSYFPKLNKSDKVLLYAFTFRPYNLDNVFPLSMYNDFNAEELQAFLKSNNMVMLVSTHPKVAGSISINNSYIKFIDTEKAPFFDINLLLPEIDVLIGDYSTIHTEFAILDRPQIYVMLDYDEYFWKRGFLEDFRQNLAGKEALSFNHLLKIIEEYIREPSRDNELRKKLLDKYYDVEITKSCEKNYLFLKKLTVPIGDCQLK